MEPTDHNRRAWDEIHRLRAEALAGERGLPKQVRHALADLSTKIIVEEDGPFIHAMPYRAGSYNDDRTPLMHEIRTCGIDL